MSRGWITEYQPKGGKWKRVHVAAQYDREGVRIKDLKLIIGTQKGDKARSIVDLDKDDVKWLYRCFKELYETEWCDNGSGNTIPGQKRA